MVVVILLLDTAIGPTRVGQISGLRNASALAVVVSRGRMVVSSASWVLCSPVAVTHHPLNQTEI